MHATSRKKHQNHQRASDVGLSSNVLQTTNKITSDSCGDGNSKKIKLLPRQTWSDQMLQSSHESASRKLKSQKHCSCITGEHVQANDEPSPSNTNAPLMLDCIYLRPTNNQQGGHQLLNLATNRVINRRHLIRLPISKSTINQVHKIAASESMPAGLKITKRTCLTLCDSDWTAGVDFECDDYSDEEDSNENQVCDVEHNEDEVNDSDDENKDEDDENMSDESETLNNKKTSSNIDRNKNENEVN